MDSNLKKLYSSLFTISFVSPLIYIFFDLVSSDVDWDLSKYHSLVAFLVLEIDFAKKLMVCSFAWIFSVGIFIGFFIRDDDIHDGYDKPIFKRYNWKGEEVKTKAVP